MKEIGWICGGTGDMRNAYKMSIPKPHWKTPLKLRRYKWKDSTKI